jgi:hypothetical protein
LKLRTSDRVGSGDAEPISLKTRSRSSSVAVTPNSAVRQNSGHTVSKSGSGQRSLQVAQPRERLRLWRRARVDDHESVKPVRGGGCHFERDQAAEAVPDDHRVPELERVGQRAHVGGQILDLVAHSGRALPVTAQVDADHGVPCAQRPGKRTKVVAAERDSVDEDARGVSRALDAVSEGDRLKASRGVHDFPFLPGPRRGRSSVHSARAVLSAERSRYFFLPQSFRNLAL